jgi:ATP-binding cassette subfamily F protein uup
LISDFDGTVLLVSHDRVFLDNIVTGTLAFEGEGRVVEYVGGWADYQSQKSARLQPPERGGALDAAGRLVGIQRGAEAPRSWCNEVSVQRSARKLSYNEQRELDSLPAHIEALEAEQQRLVHESQSPEFYKESANHIHAVLARIEQVGQELDAAMARWVELEERAQQIRDKGCEMRDAR